MMIVLLIESRDGKLLPVAFEVSNDEDLREKLEKSREQFLARGKKIVRVLRDITHEWKAVIDPVSETEGG